MSVLAIAIFIVCPVLALPFVFVGLKKDKRHRVVYLGIIALFIALFSYNITPSVKDDLYRHQTDAMEYSKWDWGDVMSVMPKTTEQAALIYKYLIGKTGDVRLLQFFATFLSYFIIFYLIDYYVRKSAKMDQLSKTMIALLVATSFSFITVSGNIFCNLALVLFSFGFFIKYEKKRNVLGIVLCVSAILIHSSTLFALALYALFWVTGKKCTLRNIIVMIASVMAVGVAVSLLSDNINIPLFREISNLYDAYFYNEQEWGGLHTSYVMIISILKIVPVLFACLLSHERNTIDNWALYICIAIIAMLPQTSFSIRYIPIAVLSGIPALVGLLEKKEYKKIAVVCLSVLVIIQISSQIPQILNLNFSNLNNVCFPVIGYGGE